MPKRRLLVFAASGAAALLVFCAWLTKLWAGESVTRAVSDIGQMVCAALGATCCFVAGRSTRGRRRVTWLALGGGLAAWSVGEAFWSYYELWRGAPEAPFPSLADAGFLCFPVGAALALVSFGGGRLGQSRLRLVLDGALVAGSLFIVSWVTVLGRVYEAGGTGPFALTVSLAYPVADVMLVTMAVLVLTRVNTAQRLTLALLTAGVAMMAVADSAFAYLTAVGSYHTGSLIDAAWVAAFLVLGLAALSSADGPAADADAASAPTRTRLWLPYVPLLLAGVVGLQRFVPNLYSGPVPGVALALVIVILARQFITLAENRRLLVTVAHQALHDPLTGLANRALFTDRLEHAVQLHRRDEKPLALLFVDLNDFKLVNDSFGHGAGDDVLVHVARRLSGCLRDSDTVARLGGDEFAILIEEGADNPLAVADRVIEAFAVPFTVDGHTVTIHPSIGLATPHGSPAELSAESLLKQADTAMYVAKRNRGSGVQVFTTTMTVADLDERHASPEANQGSDIGAVLGEPPAWPAVASGQ